MTTEQFARAKQNLANAQKAMENVEKTKAAYEAAMAEFVKYEPLLEAASGTPTVKAAPAKKAPAKKAAPVAKKAAPAVKATPAAKAPVAKVPAKKAAPVAKKPAAKAPAAKKPAAKARDNAQAARGRAEVKAGLRPTIKEAMTQVMTDKTMNAAEIYDLLKAKGWLPSANDPRGYIAYLLSSFKDRFERMPDKGRGYYRVLKGAAPVAAKGNGASKKGTAVEAAPVKAAAVKPVKAAPVAKRAAPAKKPAPVKAAAAKPNNKKGTDAILEEAGVNSGEAFGG